MTDVSRRCDARRRASTRRSAVTARKRIRTSAAARSSGTGDRVTATVRAAEHDGGRAAAPVSGAAVGLPAGRAARDASSAASCSGSITRIRIIRRGRRSSISITRGRRSRTSSWSVAAGQRARRHDRVVSEGRPIQFRRGRASMATKILIPTPLRPYTDKKDAVEADGATVGELLADLTTKHAGPQGASVQRAGQAAQLRQRLPERRRHPLSAEGADAGVGRRHGQHHSVGRRRRARP